jgi:NAD-dependent DNA ligase
VRFLRTSPPTSADGIEKCLSSGMIRGVGPVFAKKLVRCFGEKVFDVIEATPDRLREVDGIGPVRAASILDNDFVRQAIERRFLSAFSASYLDMIDPTAPGNMMPSKP